MVMGLTMIVGAHSEDEVQYALDWASNSIESYCERKFAWVEADVVTVNPYRGDGGRGQAMLPNPPVSNVSNVMAWMPINGSLQWTNLQYYGWAEDGLIYDTSKYYGYFGVTGSSFWSGNDSYPYGWLNIPSWPSLPRSLQVTYDHGYALPNGTYPSNAPALPQGIVDAVVKGASFYLDNASGALENRVGDLTTRYMEPTGPAGWLDEKLLGAHRMVYL